MKKTIMVVDDKISVQMLIEDYLTERGYRVVRASNGRDALLVARNEKPDLILLDIMMPEMDGYEFIRTYHKEQDTPIILLTAKLEEADKVVGLELGADDYVTKPFGMAELVARVRAVIRRSEKTKEPGDVLRSGNIILDLNAHQVSVAGQNIDLTPSEFRLLHVLMTTPGRAFSRAELLERLKGDSLDGVERTIDVHIRNLRTKIEPDPSRPAYIQTVFGTGYRFNAHTEGDI
ncbi:MAG: response regulator transcription factor [Chloroflexota bacterium]